MTDNAPTIEPLAVGDGHLRRLIPDLPTGVTLLDWEKKKLFPRRLILGPRVHVWMLSDIRAWLEERQRSAEADMAARSVTVRKQTRKVRADAAEAA